MKAFVQFAGLIAGLALVLPLCWLGDYVVGLVRRQAPPRAA